MHADKLKFAGSLQGHIMIRMPGARIDEDLIKRFSIYDSTAVTQAKQKR